MSKLSRRDFVKGAAVIGTSLSAASWARVLGANEDVRVAVVGCGGQGSGHVGRFMRLDHSRVVALCDVDESHLAKNVEKIKGRDKSADVATFIDYRKLLEDKNIDAIVTATPNHWHSLVTVWACQAGKDVYVEKPISHNLWEGRQCVRAARKYNRIVQAGTQKRSDRGLQDVFAYIQEGNLGKIVVARGFCYKRRGSIGKVAGPQEIPGGVHYDLWTGPAELEPLRRNRLHYDWHWVWNTGNGDMGNQGIHEMDLCRWALGQDKLPPRVMSIGGRLGYDDDGETANTQIAVLDYKPVPIIFETRGLPAKKGGRSSDSYLGTRIGIIIQCENGYFAGGDGGGWTYDNDGKKLQQFTGSGGAGHHQNFIDAVRSQKKEDLNADIHEGHISSACCHLGNISHRLGRTVLPEDISKAIQGDALTIESYQRLAEHLKANEIDTATEKLTLGPWLNFDPETERFIEDSPYGLHRYANDMLTRDYREPFVVPENV